MTVPEWEMVCVPEMTTMGDSEQRQDTDVIMFLKKSLRFENKMGVFDPQNKQLGNLSSVR